MKHSVLSAFILFTKLHCYY